MSDGEDGEKIKPGPITFINRFTEVAAPEEFERVFGDVSSFLCEQPGFVEYSLLREAEGDRNYVNIARWESLESLQQAARKPGFQAHAVALRALSSSVATIYTPRLSYAKPASGGGE